MIRRCSVIVLVLMLVLVIVIVAVPVPVPVPVAVSAKLQEFPCLLCSSVSSAQTGYPTHS